MVDIHWFRLDPTKVKIWHKMQKKTVWGALAPSLVLTALLILFSHVTQLSCLENKRQKKDVTTSEIERRAMPKSNRTTLCQGFSK